MSPSYQEWLSKESSSRYHLPAWFLERNVKASSDLEGHVCICQCEACEKYKKLYEDEETEDETPGSESTADAPQPEGESHTSSEKHETDNEDAICYAKFSELRDTVATNMLWRHMRPKDSSVLFRRCSVSGCSTCSMEPVHMNDIVGQVAKSLSMGLVSLSFEDLEELGSDFHAQDKVNVVSGDEKKTAEKESTEITKETSTTTETSTGESTTTEASSDKAVEKNTKKTSDKAKTPKEPVKDEWKADWSNGATFTDRFFASKSKKWQDEEKLSYSAWRDRTKQSYATILDGASVKLGQEGKPQEEHPADTGMTSNSRGLLVHFIDCDHSGLSLDHRQKRRVLVRLGELVQERRGNGQDVVLIISSRTLGPEEKLCQKAGVSTLSGVTLSIVNPSKQGAEDRDHRRKGAINARRLRWILETGMAQPASCRPKIDWMQNATDDDLARHGQDIWSVNDIHRAAGQILARTWIKPQPVITSKHVDSVLRRLGMITTPKPSEKTEVKEDLGASETKEDEVVEEAEKDPLESITLDHHEERFRDCVIKSSKLNPPTFHPHLSLTKVPTQATSRSHGTTSSSTKT